ncbi:MAG: hypothetical protein A2X03_09915 [Bacteroidetes bacterium GWA2_40_15]|nr:MAG: hypothetical protein A2X03_09915 [Bacteroidetes bacterium GWA2_40_15]HBH84262.1 hypothetical protein [Bacteroidales bacterium]
MKTELGNLGLIELSINETKQVKGGGPTFRWLGEVAGYVATAVDFVNYAPLYCTMGVANTYLYYQNLVNTALHI